MKIILGLIGLVFFAASQAHGVPAKIPVHVVVVTTSFIPSLEAGFRVGSPVVNALTSQWARYESHPPQP